MCLQCVFENLNFWVFYECLKILRGVTFLTHTRRRFFTAYSVHIDYFLPHTQYTWNIFYLILSRRGISFTAYSVDVEYLLPHTQ